MSAQPKLFEFEVVYRDGVNHVFRDIQTYEFFGDNSFQITECDGTITTVAPGWDYVVQKVQA